MRELVVRSQDFSDWAEAARERWSDERYARAFAIAPSLPTKAKALPAGNG